MKPITLTSIDNIDILDEAKLMLIEILNELKEKGEYRIAIRINEIIGKIEAAKKEKERLEARLRLLAGQRRPLAGLGSSLALGPEVQPLY